MRIKGGYYIVKYIYSYTVDKVSETFSDRKFYLKHKLSTASLQSSVIITCQSAVIITLPVEDCRLAVESLCFK